MSFGNTKTPLKPTKKGRWQVPMVGGKYVWSDDLINKFKAYFPKHTSRQIMAIFGISHNSMQLMKRKLHIEHDKRAIIRIQAELCKKTCEANGYYDSLRGHAVSQAALDAVAEMRKNGFHPMKALKEKNPAKYKKICQKRSEVRSTCLRKERMRVDYGLPQMTNINMPFVIYSKGQMGTRSRMKSKGYILGGFREESGERYKIFYDESTQRSQLAEYWAHKKGFKVLSIAEKR